MALEELPNHSNFGSDEQFLKDYSIDACLTRAIGCRAQVATFLEVGCGLLSTEELQKVQVLSLSHASYYFYDHILHLQVLHRDEAVLWSEATHSMVHVQAVHRHGFE